MLERPVLVYDGDCGFCKRWVHRWKRRTGEAVEYLPYQEAGSRFPGLGPEKLSKAVYLIEPGGGTAGGAKAVFRLLGYGPRGTTALIRAYDRLPGFGWACEAVYSRVARHRMAASRLTRLLWGSRDEPSSYSFSSWVFLRALGLVYLSAFLSLAFQVDGLIGSRGLLPVSELLGFASRQLGGQRFHLLPTLCWLSSSDAFLRGLCWAGAALASALAAGLAPRLTLLLLWAFYLSLVSAGVDFMGFQWDSLLLETGLLALLIAPPGLRPKAGRWEPPAGGIWLLRWLLFRLMFESGCVKLLSGDPAWRNLTALAYHYQTQPLPTPLAWYAHQLPLWWQKTSCLAMFAIELGVPFLIFLPRRPRRAGFWAFLALQVLITLTGNYAYFNLLAAALAILLLDDAALGRRPADSLSRAPRRRWLPAIASLILTVSFSQLLALFAGPRAVPRPLKALEQWQAPWRAVNQYGLFAVMTKTRTEISVEGSLDGVSWKEYGFRWKPGDPLRPLPWVAPHQPRLDWQMWFAALSDYRANPWFMRLLLRLAQGSPEALRLLASNPFSDGPPRYLRATARDYRFTTPAERSASGAWWARGEPRPYSPILTLKK